MTNHNLGLCLTAQGEVFQPRIALQALPRKAALKYSKK